MGEIGCVRRFGSSSWFGCHDAFFKGEVGGVDPVAVSEVGNGTVDSW